MVNLNRGSFDENATYIGYDTVIKYDCLNQQNLMAILKNNNANERLLIEIPNTKELNSEIASLLPENISVRVIGGHTTEYMKGMKSPNTSLVREKTTYTKTELVNILVAIEEIESKINPTWNDYQKALFLYEYLKKEITYREPKDVDGIDGIGMRFRGKNWDSLTGLVDKMSTCNGYGIMYNELLTRQNIKCTHIGGLYYRGPSNSKSSQHAWSVVTINDDSFLVDIIWDSIAYENRVDQTTGFGIKNIFKYNFRNNRELSDNLKTIDINWIETNKRLFSMQKKDSYK